MFKFNETLINYERCRLVLWAIIILHFNEAANSIFIISKRHQHYISFEILMLKLYMQKI